MIRLSLRQLMVYVWALIAIILTLFPILWVFSISAKTRRDAFALPPQWLFDPVWDNYLKLWQNEGFRNAFYNSLVVTAVGVLMAVVIAFFSAYGLHRFNFRGKQWFAMWLLLAYMLPEFLFIIPMYALYQKIGLYDTHFGLALLYQIHVLPFAVWMLRSFFREVPAELDDAARLDGCGHLRTLVHVYLPVSGPGIAATAILSAIWIWNELAIALGLTFNNAQTITVAVGSFRGYSSIDWGAMTAASIVALVPMLIFTVIAQRYIVKGLTLGSVKG